ncbi:hypothetical protein HYX13_03335 [Candidatus Woesearchaeota archaeon]|nr:hypothetical protein [Candidatus Woesearchaeota archaeon]
MVIENSEQPLYELPQSKARAIFPQTLVLLFLSSIFYAGILINLSLVELSEKNQQIIQAGTVIFLFIVILIGFFYAVKKASAKYYFYHSQLVFQKKNIFYTAILPASIIVKQDPLDKLFKTYTLQFNNFRIRSIPQSIQIQNYLQQLVSSAR